MKKKPSRTILPYRTYSFIDKDPVIDVVRTAVDDAKESYRNISEKSGVSRTTMVNWFHGRTKRPQFCTLSAVAGAIGKSFTLTDKPRRK